jgi:CRISPR-associated protein Csm4
MLTRYIIKPLAPLMTSIMSDTLFGHFCWAMRYKEGKKALEGFLRSYDGRNPSPILFSSAFPSGNLPRPTLPPLTREEARVFARRHFGNDKGAIHNGLAKIKSWNKRHLVRIDLWRSLKDRYDNTALYEMIMEDGDESDQGSPIPELTAHNRISRLFGTVPSEGGGLFTRNKAWYLPGTALDVYAQILDDTLEEFAHDFLTRYLPQTGFGADKSLGMGALEIVRDDTFKPDEFDVTEANACVSLSLTAFPGMGDYSAYYRLRTKFGKLGGDFAFISPTGGDVRPFKKPILMYEEGAVFLGAPRLETMSLLEHVHSDDRIRHCGIPITLPLEIREDLSHA